MSKRHQTQRAQGPAMMASGDAAAARAETVATTTATATATTTTTATATGTATVARTGVAVAGAASWCRAATASYRERIGRALLCQSTVVALATAFRQFQWRPHCE
jgi:hypothetical protein